MVYIKVTRYVERVMIRGIGLLDRLVGGLVYGNEIGRVGNLGDLSSSTILGFGARLRIRTLVVRVPGVLEVPGAEFFSFWVGPLADMADRVHQGHWVLSRMYT